MIKYIILDVDGTLTDSGVYYDSTGNELKKFSTKDGTGIICAREAGITVMVLTGRECAATVRRITELGVQEMGREINTTGPKANHAGIQRLVVRMKDELEKIREQSMNIL